MGQLHRLGHGKPEICKAVEAIELAYSASEIQAWASDYEAVAVQEVDPLFRTALGAELEGQLICGSNDFDGRGIEVESSTGLLLSAQHGLRAVCSETAWLRLPLRRGMEASREHVVVLAERPEDGQQLVLCSVHLHVPAMLDAHRQSYLKYLQPLRAAIEAVAGLTPSGALNRGCLLLGDFNIHPDDFRRRTESDPFWNQFQLAVPEGGETAHRSNPCACGDFAVAAGEGSSWTGRSLGSPSFSSFEQHAAKMTRAAARRMRMSQVLQRCEEASEAARRAASELSPLAEDPHQHDGALVLRQLESVGLLLQRAERRLRRELRSTATLRRGLSDSDHRPLHFVGTPAVVEVPILPLPERSTPTCEPGS